MFLRIKAHVAPFQTLTVFTQRNVHGNLLFLVSLTLICLYVCTRYNRKHSRETRKSRVHSGTRLTIRLLSLVKNSPFSFTGTFKKTNK